MTKLFDEEGQEVEAFTKEELEAKQQEAVDEYAKNNPDQSAELIKAQKELEEANQKIKEAEEKEDGGNLNAGQKQRLIQEKKDAEAALKLVKDTMDEGFNKFKQDMLVGNKNKILDKLSGGDTELRKKIEAEYDDYSEGKNPPANEEELQSRMMKSFTIVSGSKPAPGFMDNVSGGGGKGDGDASTQSNKVETEEEKASRKALGITDEDVAKYGPKK